VRTPDGKRLLARPRHIRDYNIKWNLKKWDVETLAGLFWLRIGAGVGCL